MELVAIDHDLVLSQVFLNLAKVLLIVCRIVDPMDLLVN